MNARTRPGRCSSARKTFGTKPVFSAIAVDARAQVLGRVGEVGDGEATDGGHLRQVPAMGEIHVHEFMTVDGVVDTPSWTFEYGFDPQMGEAIGAVTARSERILLGRVTYEMFAPAWSARTGDDDPGAPFFNGTHKHVVSGTLTDRTGGPPTSCAYDPDAIRELKAGLDGDLYVSGSVTLVRAMLADGLVDGLHLFVFPLTLGEGLRLFEPGAPGAKLALEQHDRYDNGVVYLNYRPEA